MNMYDLTGKFGKTSKINRFFKPSNILSKHRIRKL